MKVIVPYSLEAALLSSNVPESDRPEYVSTQAYSIGEVVQRTNKQRIYRALIAVPAGKTPELNPDYWFDTGSTNRWRMLRTDSNIQTVRVSPLIVQVQGPTRLTAIALSRLNAEKVTIETNYGYKRVIDLRRRVSNSWSQFFFGEFKTRRNVLQLDHPYTQSPIITFTLERANGGEVGCGPVVLGTPIDIGATDYGGDVSNRDFSSFDRNFAGDATLVKRRGLPTISATTYFAPELFGDINQSLSELTAVPALWFGVDDALDPFFDPYFIIGLLKSYRFSPENFSEVRASLDLEGY